MSGIETERKFLVLGDGYKRMARGSSRIRQGYIPADGATVRVRMRDEQAFLTIKGRPAAGGFSRYEFETEISPAEAEELFKLCRGGEVEKRRWLVESGGHVFEVDEFFGANEGLVVAEVELSREDESFERPTFIGAEVTFDPRYRNSYLCRKPFKEW